MKEEFLKELKLLLMKYDVGLTDSDNYTTDSDENEIFAGTDYYLKFNDNTDWSETLVEMIKKLTDCKQGKNWDL